MGSPTPGWYSWRFLEDEIGLGADQGETIGNLLEWARAEMEHMVGGGILEDFEYYWGHQYAIPLRAVLEGTDPEGFVPYFLELGWEYDAPFAHHTWGCHGTSSMMYTVLRAANVPSVHVQFNGGHSIPWLSEDDLYLTHGDDPYNQMAKTADYPAGELLIDQATFDAWAAEPSTFVGRRVHQLSAIWLPQALLKRRCVDLDAGTGESESEVYEALDKHYSLQDLEGMGFWQALDAEVAAEGGCAVINPGE